MSGASSGVPGKRVCLGWGAGRLFRAPLNGPEIAPRTPQEARKRSAKIPTSPQVWMIYYLRTNLGGVPPPGRYTSNISTMLVGLLGCVGDLLRGAWVSQGLDLGEVCLGVLEFVPLCYPEC